MSSSMASAAPEPPFRPREKLVEKQRYFQSVHKPTYLKGRYDAIASVAIPLALAASSVFLVDLHKTVRSSIDRVEKKLQDYNPGGSPPTVVARAAVAASSSPPSPRQPDSSGVGSAAGVARFASPTPSPRHLRRHHSSRCYPSIPAAILSSSRTLFPSSSFDDTRRRRATVVAHAAVAANLSPPPSRPPDLRALDPPSARPGSPHRRHPLAALAVVAIPATRRRRRSPSHQIQAQIWRFPPPPPPPTPRCRCHHHQTPPPHRSAPPPAAPPPDPAGGTDLAGSTALEQVPLPCPSARTKPRRRRPCGRVALPAAARAAARQRRRKGETSAGEVVASRSPVGEGRHERKQGRGIYNMSHGIGRKKE
uniref:Uncharacterized protein n=1 Tax=Oryza nivara TaxID=4536 RepID=A0A0E0HFH8_ORYNI